MATFMGLHDMGASVTDEQMGDNWQAYKAACGKLGCETVHVHFNSQKGLAYCLTEADSAETVRKAHEAAGVPVQDILEVKTAD
jgi:hypothetical protein